MARMSTNKRAASHPVVAVARKRWPPLPDEAQADGDVRDSHSSSLPTTMDSAIVGNSEEPSEDDANFFRDAGAAGGEMNIDNFDFDCNVHFQSFGDSIAREIQTNSSSNGSHFESAVSAATTPEVGSNSLEQSSYFEDDASITNSTVFSHSYAKKVVQPLRRTGKVAAVAVRGRIVFSVEKAVTSFLKQTDDVELNRATALLKLILDYYKEGGNTLTHQHDRKNKAAFLFALKHQFTESRIKYESKGTSSTLLTTFRQATDKSRVKGCAQIWRECSKNAVIAANCIFLVHKRGLWKQGFCKEDVIKIMDICKCQIASPLKNDSNTTSNTKSNGTKNIKLVAKIRAAFVLFERVGLLTPTLNVEDIFTGQIADIGDIFDAEWSDTMMNLVESSSSEEDI